MTASLSLVTPGSALDLVRSKLSGVRDKGRYFIAKCPAHDDDMPSLSVGRGKKQPVVFKCHRGCSQDSILGALGLTFADVSEPSREILSRSEAPVKRSSPTLVKTWDYVDENGVKLFESCRFEYPLEPGQAKRKKKFNQRHMVAGNWVWTLDGVRRVLYRLPEVVEDVAAGRVIYVVEGEKCADRLRELGFCATTNPMGAGKWLPEYTAVLAGAAVVILADNDEPGEKHAVAVADALVEAKAIVKLVRFDGLADKEDVIDWLERHGGTADKLRALVNETETWDEIKSRTTWVTETGTEMLPAIRPIEIADAQVGEAMRALDRHPSTFVRWPFSDLDALTGPMAPGNVWFVCAASGGGKSTFVASVIDKWRWDRKKVYVMALETRAFEFRTYLACMAVGFPPGDALSGQLLTLPDGQEWRDRIVAELKRQRMSPYVDQVMISGQRAINLDGARKAFKEAKAFGADAIIVDHIDHLEGGDGSNLFSEAKKINHGILRMAQDNGILAICTSQLNMDASSGDYLTKYLPPKDNHVLFGGLKRQVCTGMIGLFRPIRRPMPGESEEEFTNAMKLARTQGIGIPEMLEPNTMGVSAMKLRHYGTREGMRISLSVEKGRVDAMLERDKYATGFGGRVHQVQT